MKNKNKIILGISILFLVVLVVAIIFRSRKKKNRSREKPKAKKKKKIDLSNTTIANINPEQRADIAYQYDNLFKVEDMETEVPFFDFEKNWLIKFLPPKKNISIRYLITNEIEKNPVLVMYDPYGIYTNKPDTKYWVIKSSTSQEAFINHDRPDEVIKTITKFLESAQASIEEI